MKRMIIIVIVLVVGMALLLKSCQGETNKPIIRINALEVKLYTSSYHDITARSYTETDRRDWIYLFTSFKQPNIYAGTSTEGSVTFLDENDSLIYYIGLDVDESIHTLEIDELDFLSITKEELAKKYDLIEFNDKIRFVYEDNYFVCLSYTDNKLDGFAVMYNTDGKRSVRDVDLDFRQYKDQWIIK